MAAKITTTTEPERKERPALTDAQAKALPKAIVDYVKVAHSADPNAPGKGAPFVYAADGRVYLQLDGRVPGADLLAHLRKAEAFDGVQKTAVRDALVALGFRRQPFSYPTGEGKNTSASYYSVEANKLPALPKSVKMRSDHRKAKNGNGGKSTEVSDEDAALLKVRADGSES